MSASIDSPSANVNLAWLSAEWSTRSPVPAVPQRSAPVNPWQRMRSNAAAVRPVLRDAGISADRVRSSAAGAAGWKWRVWR